MDSVAGLPKFVVLSIVSTLCVEFASSAVPDLYSEWLCWCLLFAGIRAYRYLHPEEAGAARRDGSDESNKLAFGIVAACVCRTLDDVDWVAPFLTPAIYLCLQYLPSTGGAPLPLHAEEESSPKTSFLERCLSPTTAYILIACGSCVPLLPISLSIPVLGMACLFLLCQTAVYILLMKRNQTGDEKPTSLLLAVEPSCLRIVAILTLILMITPKRAPPLVVLGIAAVTKVLLWGSILILCRRGHSITASAIFTFGVSTIQVQFQSSILLAGGAGLGAVVALWQTFHSTLRWNLSRKVFIAFALVPLLIFLYKPTFSDRPLKWVAGVNDRVEIGSIHPIDELMRSAQQRYATMVQGQSNTLQEAVQEYKRRYHRSPPPNFDVWFKSAKKNKVILVDEFDVIMETLEPFWGIAPAEIRDRVQLATQSKATKVFSIKNHVVSATSDGSDWLSEEIVSWLPFVQEYLPDMDLILNLLDEPRVVVPRDMLDAIFQRRFAAANSLSIKKPASPEPASIDFVDINKQNVWNFITLSCPVDSPSRQPSLALHNATHLDLPFIQNATASKDICSEPEYATTHGFFISPSSSIFTNTLVPVFSQAKPSSFQDVLYPSPYYTESYDLGKYNEGDDIDWEKKQNQLYWAGSTTGGHSRDGNWRHQHRQRWVEFANAKDEDIVLLNETLPGKWLTYRDTMGSLSHLFNVKFTSVIQCDEADCVEEKEHFHISGQVGMSETYRSKFVFDLDGNGFSGRFYRLLGSKSAVLKQTLFREWHDDWLVPWVHYIPVSMSMKELPEIMRYMALTPAGQEWSRRIAEDSRTWARIALRKEDLQSVFFRLLLEYGRLISDDRDTLAYG